MKELTLTAIDQIDGLCKEYAGALNVLSEVASKFEKELAALRARHAKSIKLAAAEAALREKELHESITANPDLFVKPRTFTLHGVRVGYQKGKGKILCPDEPAAIERIEKLLPDQAAALVRSEKKIVRDALKGLDVATLKKIGLSVVGTEDAVLIKAEIADMEKLAATFLDVGPDEENQG